ncbi:sugar kinase [Pleurocapsales cyanobacterium LEGE 06147]|nr:sugar kinase [Pleurocapsales cyanobacterium LEGE 06147]
MQFRGLFVGLATLDLIYLVDRLPNNNQKIVALDQTIAAGGPATNAAVTFSHLGSKAKLLGILGNHPISQLIRADLTTHSIEIIDLQAEHPQSPPVSSIFVTQSTGERAVISVNAVKSQATVEQLPKDILEKIDLVLLDGHQMAISQAIAPQAKSRNIPVVLDGGSWKPGLEKVLPYVDHAICSADFYPPSYSDRREDVLAYLQAAGISYIAITRGERPIFYFSEGKIGEITVPQVSVKDTVGAGDIFHGAFCHYILQQSFIPALTAAAQVASRSCQFFGTRQLWQFT